MSEADEHPKSVDQKHVAEQKHAAEAARWLDANRDAIEAYNQMIEQDGYVFSDGARTF